MFFPSATAVAAMVLVLNPAGTSSIASRTVTPLAARGAESVAPSTRLVSALWAPPKKAKKAPRESEGESQEEELLRPQRTPPNNGGTTAPKKRRPIKMDESADEGGGDDEADEGGDDDDDEDRPKVTKKRKRVSEDEEDESPEPLESQPSVIPRLINFLAAPAVVRRSFGFNEASLQGDTGFRMGYQLSLESFPLVTQPNGWYRTIGLGITYEKEYGDATHNASSGMFNGYPFNQSRLGIDLRFAIPAGDSVIIMPAIGYGRVGADLQRPSPTTPTNCTVSSAMDPCFGDVNASYLSVDVHIRVGLTPTFALSLAGGYLQGLGVQRGMDQITAEGAATMKGFHVEAGASVLLADWVAFQAVIPFRRYGFSFEPASGTSFSYRGAADTYYGLVAGLALFTK
jgi:hypothetical protein